jgi:hypothetical protein
MDSTEQTRDRIIAVNLRGSPADVTDDLFTHYLGAAAADH